MANECRKVICMPCYGRLDLAALSIKSVQSALGREVDCLVIAQDGPDYPIPSEWGNIVRFPERRGKAAVVNDIWHAAYERGCEWFGIVDSDVVLVRRDRDFFFPSDLCFERGAGAYPVLPFKRSEYFCGPTAFGIFCIGPINCGVWMQSRYVLKKVGYWYEPFGSIYLDYEMCARIRAANLHTAYVDLNCTMHLDNGQTSDRARTGFDKQYDREKVANRMRLQVEADARVAGIAMGQTNYYWAPERFNHGA